MIKSESQKSLNNVCDFSYLAKMVNRKKHLILGIMDVFLKQIPEELQYINEAIIKTDYSTISNYSHTMRSSVSIMGISVLSSVLQEMEELGKSATGIERIKELNKKLTLICNQSIEETEREKLKYI
ncbi:MAG: Hpt domain-containing protein [Bacteroidota bacterium]